MVPSALTAVEGTAWSVDGVGVPTWAPLPGIDSAGVDSAGVDSADVDSADVDSD
jgi:hypothetical protein